MGERWGGVVTEQARLVFLTNPEPGQIILHLQTEEAGLRRVSINHNHTLNLIEQGGHIVARELRR